MADPTNYCTNCNNLPVCKYASKITQMDNEVTKFNLENQAMPIRISVTSVSYVCRHKDLI